MWVGLRHRTANTATGEGENNDGFAKSLLTEAGYIIAARLLSVLTSVLMKSLD